MKNLLILLLFFAPVLKSNAQTPAIDTLYVVDTTARDTVPALIPVLDSSHYYDVYRSTGIIFKHNADVYFTIPLGGKRVKLGLINNNMLWIEGFEVYKTRLDFRMELVAVLNALYEPIGPPYLRTGIGIPTNGF
jgi:hypothetical protein